MFFFVSLVESYSMSQEPSWEPWLSDDTASDLRLLERS